MAALLIGYARVSTDQQDLTAQRNGLTALGVAQRQVRLNLGGSVYDPPTRSGG